jgi:GT2 family glycosyltransferase
MSRSVIGLTLNYRDADRTQRCVESLLSEGVENILVWDNSADDEKSATKLRLLFADDPRIHIQVSKENVGFASGVNQGLEWVRTHYPDSWVFIINNDAVVLEGGLAIMCSLLTMNPESILVYPDIDHNGRVLGTIWYHKWFALITYKPLPGSFSYASGCAMLFSPERWHGCLFDEDFFMYGEDIFLGWKHRTGTRLLHVPRVCVWHEGSASSGMASQFYEERLVISHLQLADKMSGNVLESIFLFGARYISLFVRALIRTFRYRSAVPIKSLVNGVAAFYKMMGLL